MGKMVKTSRGWKVWPTPFWYHIDGTMFFALGALQGRSAEAQSTPLPR